MATHLSKIEKIGAMTVGLAIFFIVVLVSPELKIPGIITAIIAISIIISYAFMAKEFLESYIYLNNNSKFIDLLKRNEDATLVLFPDNYSLNNHLENLCNLMEDLSNSPGSRNTLMFIGNGDDDQESKFPHYLRLINCKK